MAFRSLGAFLDDLDASGDLLRVAAPVHQDLEIAELTRRVVARDGPALLFENVVGASMPVAMGVLASPRRIVPGARGQGVLGDRGPDQPGWYD